LYVFHFINAFLFYYIRDETIIAQILRKKAGNQIKEVNEDRLDKE